MCDIFRAAPRQADMEVDILKQERALRRISLYVPPHLATRHDSLSTLTSSTKALDSWLCWQSNTASATSTDSLTKEKRLPGQKSTASAASGNCQKTFAFSWCPWAGFLSRQLYPGRLAAQHIPTNGVSRSTNHLLRCTHDSVKRNCELERCLAIVWSASNC